MNSARSNSLSLKYHRFTPSSCKDIGIRIFEFVAKTQFLSERFSKIKSVLNISKCRSNVLSKMSVPLSLIYSLMFAFCYNVIFLKNRRLKELHLKSIKYKDTKIKI